MIYTFADLHHVEATPWLSVHTHAHVNLTLWLPAALKTHTSPRQDVVHVYHIKDVSSQDLEVLLDKQLPRSEGSD